jgi:hypothetical protein
MAPERGWLPGQGAGYRGANPTADGSPQALLLAARRQGYRITRIDLLNAWLEHQHFPETPVHDALPGTAAWS